MPDKDKKNPIHFLRESAQRLFAQPQKYAKYSFANFSKEQIDKLYAYVRDYLKRHQQADKSKWNMPGAKNSSTDTSSTASSAVALAGELRDKKEESSFLSSRSTSLASVASISGVAEAIDQGRAPIVAKIDDLVQLASKPQWAQEYVDKVNADAKAMFGDSVSVVTAAGEKKAEETILLNTQQLDDIAKFLALHKSKIADWFNMREDERVFDNPSDEVTVDILRLGRKPEDRALQFQAGELPRSIELHKVGDELKIYIIPSKKLASGSKAETLARGGMAKKVTHMILLNPTSLKQRLLDMVTKRQSTQEDIATELALEQKAYGAHATVIGLPYMSKGKEKVRTAETAAVCDMFEYMHSMHDKDKAERFMSLDARYDPKNPASKDVIMEGLIADCLKCLEQIHAAGIIHKDIKLENILIIVEDGRLGARITDFGLAEDMQVANPRLDILSGTPEYFSPQHVLHSLTIASCSNKKQEVNRATKWLKKRDFYGKDIVMNWVYGHNNDSALLDQHLHTNTSAQADDMWAFGVTMFRLITYSDPMYLSMDDAARDHPLIQKHKELLSGLLAFEREARPDAKKALAMINKEMPKRRPQ